MKIYIAGPMTGIEELNFPLFFFTAARLRAEGYDVVNPAEINANLNVKPSAVWAECMSADIRELMTCDAVFMLPGWGASRGAILEHHIASALGMVVLLEIPILEASI